MKKMLRFVLPFLVMLVSIILVSLINLNRGIVIVRDNHGLKPIEITANRYQDAHCGMSLPSADFAGQVISPDGKTWFFHDPGGIPLWLKAKTKSFKDQATIWFFTMDTKRWLTADKTWFSVITSTPMGYGFAAHEHKGDGFIQYREMAIRMERGEHMLNPRVRTSLLRRNHANR